MCDIFLDQSLNRKIPHLNLTRISGFENVAPPKELENNMVDCSYIIRSTFSETPTEEPAKCQCVFPGQSVYDRKQIIEYRRWVLIFRAGYHWWPAFCF